MNSKFDFIVVGGMSFYSDYKLRRKDWEPSGGTSGSVLGSRLANSPAKPSVLILEAGGDNKDPSYFLPVDRTSLAFTEPSLNWGYQTEPQTNLSGQRINYARGKGLGGSSAINFCAWIIGPDEDYNEWARLVGDDDYDWKHVKETYKTIENYHVETPNGHEKWINPKSEGTLIDEPICIISYTKQIMGLMDHWTYHIAIYGKKIWITYMKQLSNVV